MTTGPEYRWYASLCAAYGVDAKDADWLKWAAEEWGGWLGETTAERLRGFQRSFERRVQQTRFRRDMRTDTSN